MRHLRAAAIVYLAVGVAIYAGIVPTFFVADDFSYLDAIRTDSSLRVLFSPLADRYFRPAVVAVYYVNYALAGLSAWPYHLSVVVMNAVNALLVCMLGSVLAPERGRLMPFLAGFLFLVFGGHAEAVSWIGGMADPLVTMFVLAGLLLFLRSFEADSRQRHRFFLGCWTAFAAALLSKESAVVFPLMIVVCAVLAGRTDRLAWKHMLVVLAGTALLLIAYFLVRSTVLGFTFVRLEGLGTSPNILATSRAFVLRSFFPQGPVFMAVWYRFMDVWLLAPVVAALFWRLRRGDYRPLSVIGLSFGVALLPVLPLSIGVVTPESERLAYMATAFSSLLLVSFVERAIERRWLVISIVAILCAGHLHALLRINRNWRDAAAIAEGSLSSFSGTVKEHGRAGSAVYVLNVPDNVRGAYIFRRGFHEALRVTAPDQPSAMVQAHVLSVHGIADSAQPVQVFREGPRTVRIRFGGGRLIATAVPPTPGFSVRDVTADGFVADFSAAADGSLVVYFTPRQTALVGRLPFDSNASFVFQEPR